MNIYFRRQKRGYKKAKTGGGGINKFRPPMKCKCPVPKPPPPGLLDFSQNNTELYFREANPVGKGLFKEMLYRGHEE